MNNVRPIYVQQDGQKRAASRRHQMAIGVEQQNMWRRREMQRGFERLKQKFGTGERAERLARTLQTLQVMRNDKLHCFMCI